MIWVRSIFFFCGMAASAVLFCPIALIVWPIPVVARMRIIGLWARFIGWWLALTCQLRFEVEGVEHLPSQPGVILSKHQSAWETILFQVIFPPQTWALKREALWLPFFGQLRSIGHPRCGRLIVCCARVARRLHKGAGS